ncbi:hypothetical protein ACEWY4_004981 [Coilia grayii]|uniref:Pyrin domain-containing protein n=1 Tax=Coilia grayii TaxID=363190 RepID=A0ABD1KH10_9TELE
MASEEQPVKAKKPKKTQKKAKAKKTKVKTPAATSEHTEKDIANAHNRSILIKPDPSPVESLHSCRLTMNAAQKAVLRDTLDNLSDGDFKAFKHLLKDQGKIKWRQLEAADRSETVDLMVQVYISKAGDNMLTILRKMNQNQLVMDLKKKLERYTKVGTKRPSTASTDEPTGLAKRSTKTPAEKPAPTSKPKKTPSQTSAPISKPKKTPAQTSTATSKPKKTPSQTSTATSKPKKTPSQTSAPTSKPKKTPAQTSAPTNKPKKT